MASNKNGLFLALELDGFDESPSALRDAVASAEKSGFAFVTFGDSITGPGDRIDAGTRAAFVASITSSIGLAPTVHTLNTEPFFLATQLVSLDHASHGRAAWVVGADNSAASHDAVGSSVRRPDSAAREIRDVIELSRQLWDSWEDDAVIRDAASGRYLDPDKVHHVRFEGEFFDVVGPLITPRSPQGQVVVIADTTLGVTDLIDIALVTGDTVDEIAASAGAARRAGAPLVFADEPSADLVDALVGVVDGIRVHLAAGVDPENVAAQLGSVLHRPVAGGTLRGGLGLERPVSRYAVQTQN